MRLMLTALFSATTLFACASTPAPAPAPHAEKAAETSKSPQCYSGDADKFFDVGSTTSIAGVAVMCLATADGKSAAWDGAKAK